MVDLPAIKGSTPGTPLKTPCSRPGTNKLEINGSAPPSRMGTGVSTRLSTGARAGSKGGKTPMSNSPMGVLAQKLILRMRAKFGDAAADVQGQEMITQEVMLLVSRPGSVQEEDISALELKIRSRLVGGSPAKYTLSIEKKLLQQCNEWSKIYDFPSNVCIEVAKYLFYTDPCCTYRKHTLSIEKKLQQEGNEWSKIYDFSIQKGKALDEKEARRAHEERDSLRATLRGQMAEVEDRKKQEQEQEMEYFRQEQAEVEESKKQEMEMEHFQQEQTQMREWDKQEEARQKLKQDLISRLKQERSDQLAEKETRRQNVRNKTAQEEYKAAANLAYETQREVETEEAQRNAAKHALKSFLLQNESNKQVKEQTKQKTYEEDKQFTVKWEEILDKQEKDRHRQLETVRAKQQHRAELAKNGVNCARSLADQIAERETIKANNRADDEAKAKMVLDRAITEEKREQEKKLERIERGRKFKLDLDAQMKEKAAAKRNQPMTVTEKKINSDLLTQVKEYQKTGRVVV
eukprot:gene28397-31533_t